MLTNCYVMPPSVNSVMNSDTFLLYLLIGCEEIVHILIKLCIIIFVYHVFMPLKNIDDGKSSRTFKCVVMLPAVFRFIMTPTSFKRKTLIIFLFTLINTVYALCSLHNIKQHITPLEMKYVIKFCSRSQFVY